MIHEYASNDAIVTPEGVFIIGTYDGNGVPNAMNAAWGQQSDYGQITLFLADLPRGEPRGFAREGFWLGKVLIFHTEVFRVVLTDKPLWDRYLLRSQPSKPLTGQLRADGTLLGSIRSLFQEPGAKSNALLW